jgi:hypothetical protein
MVIVLDESEVDANVISSLLKKAGDAYNAKDYELARELYTEALGESKYGSSDYMFALSERAKCFWMLKRWVRRTFRKYYMLNKKIMYKIHLLPV